MKVLLNPFARLRCENIDEEPLASYKVRQGYWGNVGVLFDAVCMALAVTMFLLFINQKAAFGMIVALFLGPLLVRVRPEVHVPIFMGGRALLEHNLEQAAQSDKAEEILARYSVANHFVYRNVEAEGFPTIYLMLAVLKDRKDPSVQRFLFWSLYAGGGGIKLAPVLGDPGDVVPVQLVSDEPFHFEMDLSLRLPSSYKRSEVDAWGLCVLGVVTHAIVVGDLRKAEELFKAI